MSTTESRTTDTVISTWGLSLVCSHVYATQHDLLANQQTGQHHDTPVHVTLDLSLSDRVQTRTLTQLSTNVNRHTALIHHTDTVQAAQDQRTPRQQQTPRHSRRSKHQLLQPQLFTVEVYPHRIPSTSLYHEKITRVSSQLTISTSPSQLNCLIISTTDWNERKFTCVVNSWSSQGLYWQFWHHTNNASHSTRCIWCQNCLSKMGSATRRTKNELHQL